MQCGASCKAFNQINFIIWYISSLIIINVENLIYDYDKLFSRFPLYEYIIWTITIVLLSPFYAGYDLGSSKEKYKDMALLASNLKNSEAEVIISILKSYDILFLKESGEIGTTEILTGTNLYGVDIYVQPHMLEMARELINTENI